MAKDILLRKPLAQLNVGWQIRHRLSLPLPEDFLLQLAKGRNQFEPVLLRHLGGLEHRAKGDVDNSIWSIIQE